jgi:hypothetical protein
MSRLKAEFEEVKKGESNGELFSRKPQTSAQYRHEYGAIVGFTK